MYAVLTTGGKQYRAEVGQILTIEKLDVPTGESVQFDQVLLIRDGDQSTIGAPVITGATVSGKVVRQDRGPKIIVFKYKPKVRYRRKTGHRQSRPRCWCRRSSTADRLRAADEKDTVIWRIKRVWAVRATGATVRRSASG